MLNKNKPQGLPSSLEATEKLGKTKDIRPLEESYVRPNQLHIHPDVIERFAAKGLDLQWKRVYYDGGKLDKKNIMAAKQEGFTFVTAEEAPEMNESYDGFFSDEITKHKDLIIQGELALASYPFAKKAAKRRWIDEQNAKKISEASSIIKKARVDLTSKEGIKVERDQPQTRSVDFDN